LAEDALDAEDDAEEQGPQRDRRSSVTQPRASPRALAGAGRALEAGGADLEVLVGGQEDPQAGVEHEPEAAEEGGGHEEPTHPQHRQREVPGQTGRDAAGDRRRDVAVGAARRARARGAGSRAGGRVGGGRGVAHRASIVSGAQAPDHED
jgi:hypothetical protein